MDAKKREVYRRACLQSLYFFNEFIIKPTIENTPENPRLDLNPKIHKPVLDFVQDDSIKRKGILMPRGFLKSTTITKSKPMWDWLRNPEERIVIANEKWDNTKKFLNFTIEQLRTNARLHYFFPETVLNPRFIRSHRFSSKSGIDLPRKGIYDEPTIYGIGIGGASQGWHFTRGYLDDLIGKKAMLSDVIRQDTKIWFDNAKELLVVSDPYRPGASHLYVIGTHWAVGDMYSQIQEERPEYQWIKITAEDENGEPTWPEKASKQWIEDMKTNPSDCVVFYTQYQNNPMETDLSDFKPNWLKYYSKITSEDGKPAIKYVDQEQKEQFALIKELDIQATIDPASFGEGGVKRLCRTAVVLVGTDTKTNLHFVLEAWAKRLQKPSQLFDQIFKLHEQYHPRKWGMETFTGGNVLFTSLREETRKQNIYLPLIELDKDVGRDAKENRIRNNLQDAFSSGQLYIHENQKDLKAEYLAFPMGTTKDLMDALSYHKTWWPKVNKKEIVEAQEQRYRDYLHNRSAIAG